MTKPESKDNHCGERLENWLLIRDFKCNKKTSKFTPKSQHLNFLIIPYVLIVQLDF